MEKRWRVLINRQSLNVLKVAPQQVRRKYEVWRNLIEISGPLAVRVNNVPSFRDHTLVGNWSGFRSSYLNRQYRVIYSIDEGCAHIRVEKVGPHDY